MFLDRDGVINRRIPGGYVTRWGQFEFLDGVFEALALLGQRFNRIIIVSNQQGVGKGLMSMESLLSLDQKMKKAISRKGGRIDASYYSPWLASEENPERKPGIGLGLKARTDFPEISFKESIMAGDTQTDMQFGRNLGMTTVLIAGEHTEPVDAGLIDYQFSSLLHFANSLPAHDPKPKTQNP